jgi:hypothetical protein
MVTQHGGVGAVEHVAWERWLSSGEVLADRDDLFDPAEEDGRSVGGEPPGGGVDLGRSVRGGLAFGPPSRVHRRATPAGAKRQPDGFHRIAEESAGPGTCRRGGRA